jgi:hypothetical protein
MVVFSMKNERKYNNKNKKKSLLPSFPVNNCEHRLISNGFCGAEYIGFCTSLSLIRCKSLDSSGVLYLEILWNLIELNHISYLNHDEYSKSINILFNKNNKKEKL